MSSHKSTKKDAAKVAFNDSESLLRFAETLKLRSLAVSTVLSAWIETRLELGQSLPAVY